MYECCIHELVDPLIFKKLAGTVHDGAAIQLAGKKYLKEINTREELGQTSRGQDGFGSTGTDKLLNILEEYEEEYEEENLEDQPLLKILEKMEQQVILDIEVNEHYT